MNRQTVLFVPWYKIVYILVLAILNSLRANRILARSSLSSSLNDAVLVDSAQVRWGPLSTPGHVFSRVSYWLHVTIKTICTSRSGKDDATLASVGGEPWFRLVPSPPRPSSPNARVIGPGLISRCTTRAWKYGGWTCVFPEKLVSSAAHHLPEGTGRSLIIRTDSWMSSNQPLCT